MNHRPAPSQPRPAGRGIPRTRRTLTSLSGLAVFLAPAVGLAAAAPGRLSPEASGTPVPPPPPSTAAPAHLPLWAVVAMVAGTVVLSVATTLITLAVERIHRTHRTPAAEPESSTSAAEPEDTQAAVPSKHCEDRAKPPDKASSGTTPTPTRPDIGPNPIAWLRLILDGVASDDP